MRSRLTGPAAALLLAIAGCGDGTGPDTSGYILRKYGGDGQFGEVGSLLAEAFLVEVTDGGDPVPGVSISWEIVAGGGASLTATSSSTDSAGLASTHLRLGADTGRYEVRARFAGMAGAPPAFTARAIVKPVISSVSPAQVAAGETVTITGESFSPNAADDVVLFDGIRGTVVEASGTQLRATVPRCLPTRTTAVTVRIGVVESLPDSSLAVTGDGAAPIDLPVGQVLSLSDPGDMACVRLPGGQNGVAFLAVQQNAKPLAGGTLPYQLVGVTGRTGLVASLAPRGPEKALPLENAAFGPWPTAWEARLRTHERALLTAEPLPRAPEPTAPAQAAVPAVGDRTAFNVYNKDDAFTEVTAEVKHVSDHAVIYQDVNAPAGGFTDVDFQDFAALFDDPIFPTDTVAFGQPSDIDGNGRIIILFTPVVNELTPAGATGFIAGFFYGIDLYPTSTYANSNEAEVFYSLVPDPDGEHGDARSRDVILKTVPPVLAHELQHMIHFHQRRSRDAGQEALWLSEGLAHMAEDLVADAFERRGELDRAVSFRETNYTRAFRYLLEPDAVSLIDVEEPGTLEERGAQWLMVKYLAGHFGGTAFLRSLTQGTASGVANVEAATGAAWEEIFGRWSVALWADDAGVPVDSIYTFPDIDLRAELNRNGYPLQPQAPGFADFRLAATLPVASPLHLLLEAPQLGTAPPPLHLSFSRARGDAFAAGDRPRWAILRVR